MIAIVAVAKIVTRELPDPTNSRYAPVSSTMPHRIPLDAPDAAHPITTRFSTRDARASAERENVGEQPTSSDGTRRAPASLFARARSRARFHEYSRSAVALVLTTQRVICSVLIQTRTKNLEKRDGTTLHDATSTIANMADATIGIARNHPKLPDLPNGHSVGFSDGVTTLLYPL